MDIKKLTEQYQKASEYWRKNRTNFPEVAASYEEAATALSALQAENERLKNKLSELAHLPFDEPGIGERTRLMAENALLRAELEQVKRERDAAIESWRGFCAKCAWNGKQYLSDGKMDDRCKTCRDNHKCNWEWRGQRED